MHNLRREDNFKFRLLTVKDVKISHDLLVQARKKLAKDGREHFLLYKDEEKIRSILSDSDNMIVGVFDGDILVSQMGAFSIKDDREDGEDLFPETDINIDKKDIAFLGMICVSDNYRGKNILEKMHVFLKKNNDKRCFLVASNEHNFKSFRYFLNKGFYLTQKVIDPIDGTSVIYLFKDRKWEVEFSKDFRIVDINNENYSNELTDLLSQGYVGCGYDYKTDQILFEKNEKVLKHFGCQNVSLVMKNYVENKLKEKIKNHNSVEK